MPVKKLPLLHSTGLKVRCSADFCMRFCNSAGMTPSSGQTHNLVANSCWQACRADLMECMAMPAGGRHACIIMPQNPAQSYTSVQGI